MNAFRRVGGNRTTTPLPNEFGDLGISEADMPREQGFTVSNWMPSVASTLQALFTITTTSGMTIHRCMYHARENGERWVGLPAREYKKDDGTVGYSKLIEFSTKDGHARFQREALSAIDRHLAGGAQ